MLFLFQIVILPSLQAQLSMLRIWWLLKRQKKANPFLHKVSLKSLHNFSLHLYPLNGHAQKSYEENFAEKLSGKTFITLTPQNVHSTLLNCPSDIIALSFFLWYAKKPDYFHDRTAFDHMVIVVNRLTERFNTVRGIVKELENVGCVIKPQTFLILLRIYWRGEIHAFVFEVFEEMCSYGYTPNTFARNVMMDVLFKIGRVNVALRVLRETLYRNFLTFNIAICNLCKLNDLLNIQEVVKISLREGYYPNAETFELVLNCFCKAGRLAETFQVLSLMITLGIQLSVGVWSVLTDGFCRFGRLGIAGDLFVKMVQSGKSPNVVTYTSLIKGFMKSQNVDSAISIVRMMESNGLAPDLVLCNVLINGLTKVGRYDDAFDIFLGLPRRNLEPDCYTFSSILSTICKSQKFYLLPKLINGRVIQADLVVCNSLLVYFCMAGFPDYAVKFYNDMIERDFTPDRYTFVGLLVALCKVGRVEEAVNVYHGIVMNYSGLDAHIHTVIIDGLIKVGKLHTAIKLFRNAVKEKYLLDAVSYTVAILGLIKGGRIEEACNLYTQMKDVGVDPNACICSVMLFGFCKKRDVELVSEMLQAMIDARIEMEFSTCIRVTKFLFKSKSSHSAFHLLIKMWDSGLMPGKAKHLLWLDGPAPGAKLGRAHNAMVEGYLKGNNVIDPSSSDDLFDVAASVG